MLTKKQKNRNMLIFFFILIIAFPITYLISPKIDEQFMDETGEVVKLSRYQYSTSGKQLPKYGMTDKNSYYIIKFIDADGNEQLANLWYSEYFLIPINKRYDISGLKNEDVIDIKYMEEKSRYIDGSIRSIAVLASDKIVWRWFALRYLLVMLSIFVICIIVWKAVWTYQEKKALSWK